MGSRSEKVRPHPLHTFGPTFLFVSLVPNKQFSGTFSPNSLDLVAKSPSKCILLSRVIEYRGAYVWSLGLLEAKPNRPLKADPILLYQLQKGGGGGEPLCDDLSC